MFFKLIDAWISQSSVKGVAVRNAATVYLTQNAGRNVTFQVNGQSVVSLAVQIYDSGGRQVFSQETSGNWLTWNLEVSTGKPVANGSYFYVVTTKDVSGHIINSEVKKLAILR
jgi:hypothetical protein